VTPALATKDRPELLGIFTPARAGALAGVSGDQIGQWARYDLIRPTIYEGRPANRYAFNDVAEAIVVHWLRNRGFPYEEIHHAIESARKDFPQAKWPLLRAKIGVASALVEGDRGVIAQKFEHGYEETGRPGHQIVLKPEMFDGATDMLRHGGWIADSLKLQHIEVDPEKLGGAPVLAGRRWPVERVAQIAKDSPEGWQLLRDEYDLPDIEIDESVRWATAVASL
jgi:DNA-binding transcriptional MerR regulator